MIHAVPPPYDATTSGTSFDASADAASGRLRIHRRNPSAETDVVEAVLNIRFTAPESGRYRITPVARVDLTASPVPPASRSRLNAWLYVRVKAEPSSGGGGYFVNKTGTVYGQIPDGPVDVAVSPFAYDPVPFAQLYTQLTYVASIGIHYTGSFIASAELSTTVLFISLQSDDLAG